MAAVGFRTGAAVPTYYGRADSKDAAMEWVEQVLENNLSPYLTLLPFFLFLFIIDAQVVRSLDVWDPKVGFVSLGAFAPPGAVLLWPHLRFSQVLTLKKTCNATLRCLNVYRIYIEKVELRERPRAAQKRLEHSMRSHFAKEQRVRT